ncbi:Hypothetical protein, putative [Bodo saltans]|uniref:Uncharacterized protein n=1 Tax=Bodo saltans TaxID=75058 RepID=A0A0S4IXX3_BODSA|nr:Hypothetical protein, putative [Bodo saltans]|eukprot:CUG11640.1 Hypothetical protein, putative [Bodo saltans]
MRSSSRDAFRDHAAGLFSTVRVGSCPVARERYRSAESQHQLLPAAAEHRGGDPQQRCDLRRGHCVVEGSSFYVTLRNPSRGTKLLWCARSGVPRGEVLFHASDDIGHHPANNSLYHHNAPGDGKAKGRGLPTSTTNNLSSTMNCLLSHSGSSSTVGALIPVALWSAPPTVDGVVVDTAATAAATTYSSSRGGTAGGGRSAPALVSVPPWVFEVTIPHGFWEETGGCGTLELYHYTSSSSHEVFYHPQKNGGNGMEESGGAGVGGESSTSSAQLTSAQQHGMSHLSGKQRYLDGAASASPLLVVEVLHERVVDTSAPPNTTSRTTVSSQYPPPYPPEANFMLDALHHGRHVGVYGVGSKHAFLTHVSRSHLFSETRVHCIDIGSAGAAHRVGGLTTSGRLYDELQRVEHEIVTSQRVVRRREAALQRRRDSVAATNHHASFRHQEGRLKEWKHHQTDHNERAILNAAQHVIVDLTHDECVGAVEISSPHTAQAVLQPLQYTQNASCLTPMPTPSSQQHATSQRRDKNSSVMMLSPPPRFVWEESGGSSQTPTTTTATVQKPRLDIYGGDETPQHNRKRAREIDDNDGAAMNNNSGLQADLPRSYGLQRTVFSEPPHQRNFSADGSHCERSAGFDVKTGVVDGRFPFAIPPALLRAAQTLSAPFFCQPLLLLKPSSSETSSKSSKRLGAGGLYLGDLIVIHGIDRILQLGIGGNSSSSVATNAPGINNKLPWIQEFAAMLQRVTSSAAPSAAGASSSAVGLIFSFDDPEFLVNVPRDFLHAVRPLIVQLQSPTWLLPRTGELADAHWSAPRRATVPLLHALSAAIGNSGVTGGGAAGGGGNAAGANRRRGLPLVDTVRRVILSLPEAFRQLLQLTVKKQREAGEDVFIAVPLLLEFFLSEANLFVSQGRMRPFLQELTSNRIAVYEASRHAVMILQHHLVSQVLDDVLLKGNGGTP